VFGGRHWLVIVVPAQPSVTEVCPAHVGELVEFQDGVGQTGGVIFQMLPHSSRRSVEVGQFSVLLLCAARFPSVLPLPAAVHGRHGRCALQVNLMQTEVIDRQAGWGRVVMVIVLMGVGRLSDCCQQQGAQSYG
jgi:hypothetical protein